MVASEIFYLVAINQTNQVQKRVQAILASFMIWIVVGVEILSLVLGSIPGGEGR